MKKSTPIFLTIIAILFVAVLYLLYLNFTKTPTESIIPETGIIPTEEITPTITDETANWKTYENKEYGFFFKYPLGYELTENYVTPDHNLYYVSIMKLTAPADRKGYALTNTELKIEISVSKDSSKKIISGKQLKINNHDFWYIKSSSLGGGESYNSMENNIFFTISKYPIETSLQNEFTQILSTFKFTSPTSDLLNIVKSTAATEAKTTVSKVIIGETKIVGNYAEVAFNYTTGGGAIYWAAKVNGSWKIVTGGQEPPACSTLLSYDFPADFECNK